MANWTSEEVDLIIDDYFQMLQAEIKGRSYSKTAHRNRLIGLLNNRPGGSIERKHQNISAILIQNGFPYIQGYKPLGNYQKLLKERVIDYAVKNKEIEVNFNDFATQKIEIIPQVIRYENWIETPPKSTILEEPEAHYYLPKKRNYLELEQNNRSVGFAGEELAFEYEKWRLNNAGYPKLAKEVQWVSKEQGDGAGYDILSRSNEGDEIFIEVKTTTLGKDTPIFFSKTENDFSNDNNAAFHLYRIFDIKRQPKMFTHNGRFKDICTLEAINFRGTF